MSYKDNSSFVARYAMAAMRDSCDIDF